MEDLWFLFILLYVVPFSICFLSMIIHWNRIRNGDPYYKEAFDSLLEEVEEDKAEWIRELITPINEKATLICVSATLYSLTPFANILMAMQELDIILYGEYQDN